MTKKQLKLVWYWFTCGLFFIIAGILLLFNSLLILIPGILFTLTVILFDFTEFMNGFPENEETLGTFIDKYPVLKYWLVLYCLVFLPLLIYIAYNMTGSHSADLIYFPGFLFLIGPMVFFLEKERFISFGDNTS